MSERTHIPIIHTPKPKKQKKGLKRGGPISPVSRMLKLRLQTYSKMRKEFLTLHPYCQWWLEERGFTKHDVTFNATVWVKDPANGVHAQTTIRAPLATEIHHRRGRGKYMLDTSTWMAVSREGHNWIHSHPKESYRLGYLLERR